MISAAEFCTDGSQRTKRTGSDEPRMEGIFAMAPTSTLRDSPGESITVRFSTATTVLSRDRYDESVCARAAVESSQNGAKWTDV